MEQLDQSVGEVLRRARRRRGMTLNDVQDRSDGRFKPSALGGYERADRKISLERFCELAELYGVAASQLLTEVQQQQKQIDPDESREAVIVLDRLPNIPDKSGRPVKDFVETIRALRGDYPSEVITLRANDVTSLAMAAGMKPGAFLQEISPALRT